MEKSKLINFLNKYYLGGLVESTIWELENKNLIVKFRTEDKSVMGVIGLKNVDIPDSIFGVYNTSKIINAISPLDNDFNIELTNENNQLTSLIFSDKDVKNRRTLASIDIITNTFKGFTLGDEIFDCEIPVSAEFFTKINKVKNIDSNNIGLKINNDKTATFIINYSENNVDTGNFNVPITKGDMLITPVLFNLEVFLKILNVNKDMETGKILFSSEHGVLKFSFKVGDINVMYYMVALQ